ncbi:hypothetical protein CRG98_001466 [Punica granatum]|uniref:Uncharacterized protein n=1 Tax=Punica granatum TaxID=22663 RepID=A0A2I0LBS9_PUNGR|nr:hypothetical protein CRG98_001466 [Punica granatum]
MTSVHQVRRLANRVSRSRPSGGDGAPATDATAVLRVGEEQCKCGAADNEGQGRNRRSQSWREAMQVRCRRQQAPRVPPSGLVAAMASNHEKEEANVQISEEVEEAGVGGGKGAGGGVCERRPAPPPHRRARATTAGSLPPSLSLFPREEIRGDPTAVVGGGPPPPRRGRRTAGAGSPRPECSSQAHSKKPHQEASAITGGSTSPTLRPLGDTVMAYPLASPTLRSLGGAVMAYLLEGKLGPYPVEPSKEETLERFYFQTPDQGMILIQPALLVELQVPISEANNLLRQHAEFFQQEELQRELGDARRMILKNCPGSTEIEESCFSNVNIDHHQPWSHY